MELILSLLIGSLFAAGVFMLLRRSMFKIVLGLALLGHGANLLIFTIGELNRGVAPLIPEQEKVLTDSYADPLPQALILTAIVIGFGAQAFAVVLVKRLYSLVGVDDLDQVKSTEEF